MDPELQTQDGTDSAQGSGSEGIYGADRGRQGTTVSTADLHAAETDQTSGQTQPPATPPTPADPNLAAASGQQAQTQDQAGQQQQQWTSIREAARAMGYQFGQDPADDYQAVMELVQRANASRQADYYAQLGRQLAPQAPAIQNYLAQQQQAKAPVKSEWDKPAFDEKWLGLVERDEKTGLFVGKPGVPTEIVQASNDYLKWYDKYQREPEGYIAHVAKTQLMPMFQELLEQHSARQQQQAQVQGILKQNASWLYATDQQGQPVIGQNGQPALSPQGQRYVAYIQAAKSLGISDISKQDEYARSMTYAEMVAAQQQQAAAAQQQQANPLTRAAQATPPNRNPVGTQPILQRQNNPAAPPESSAGLSMREMLEREFARAGVSDADFAFDS